jgi:ribosomal protein S18 acetylase RimI-like enzyme
MIRKIENRDIARVVEIHLAGFPGFFLSFLGPGFLSLYYAGVSSAREGIALVSVGADDVPIGFVAGAADPRGFYSKLLKRDWLRFSLASAGAIMRKPAAVKRIARAFFHPADNPAGDGTAGLFSVGVMPEMQKKGIGRELVVQFLKEAEQRGCGRVFLTTDRENNDAINSFYKNLGFIIRRQYETKEGRKMNEYWFECLSSSNCEI